MAKTRVQRKWVGQRWSRSVCAQLPMAEGAARIEGAQLFARARDRGKLVGSREEDNIEMTGAMNID